MCEMRKSRSSNSMERGINYLELIPTDVMMDIFSRLPSKSIARLRSVLKLCGSILGSPYFNELLIKKRSSSAHGLHLHCPRYTRLGFGKEICIDGVLYYLAQKDYADDDYMIVCFDVRSEKFKFMDVECCYGDLINYKGKLGGLDFVYHGNTTSELRLWGLEDVEKHQWSKSVYVYNNVANFLYFAGVTTTGEIVLATENLCIKPFYVYFLDPERNTLRSIEIQGPEAFENGGRVSAFVDYAEDLSHSSFLHMHPEVVRESHRDSKYCDGVSRDKKHREISNGRDRRDDEDIRRRRV